jgi:hypothetical protein
MALRRKPDSDPEIERWYIRAENVIASVGLPRAREMAVRDRLILSTEECNAVGYPVFGTYARTFGNREQEMRSLQCALRSIIDFIDQEDSADDDEFQITGKYGVLTRGQTGFSNFGYSDGRQFSLNEIEEKIVEPLWRAFKNGTGAVAKRSLLKLVGKDKTDNPSKLFTGGKDFYDAFISPDAKGNYRLDPEKI